MMLLTNIAYKQILKEIIEEGRDEKCRGHLIKELVNYSSSISMKYPLTTLSNRKMGYMFALAEASHIISGSNLVDNLRPFSKIIDSFSDDKVFFFGAYGPKIIDQIEYIGRCFKADISSRQAVINIWREKPAISKDIPCTLSLQYLIRDNKLICIDTMRSSDAWLGIPYDWFSLSMVSIYIAIYLRCTIPELKDLQIGDLYLNAGSQHLYLNSFYDINKVRSTLFCSYNNCDFKYEALDIREFEKPADLLYHINLLKEKRFNECKHKFLIELKEYYEQKAELS